MSVDRQAGGLLSDIADAVASNRDVDWDRCARVASAGQRRALGNLRALVPLFKLPAAAGAASSKRLRREAPEARFTRSTIAASFRRWLLTRLDAWVYPESADHRLVLVAAGSALVQTTDALHIGRLVSRSVRQACGAPATLLVATAVSDDSEDRVAQVFAAPVRPAAPPTRLPVLTHVLESTRAPVQVDPGAGASTFDLLPDNEAEWVIAGAASVLAPVIGPRADVIGIIVVGRRFDDRLVGSVDLQWVEELAAMVALALDRLHLQQAEDGVAARNPPPARECPSCGIVLPAGAARRCGCGAAYSEAPVPERLAGKIVLQRRLGAGGMGVVYLAHDIDLERPVAVKTLSSVLPAHVARLKQEARAIAAIEHSAIVQIHSLVTWRDLPLLVIEFLAGGTLAVRLEAGPIPAPQALDAAGAVASALDALHCIGYVHGDVKPSNIGFAADGSTKLLDFGLAEVTGVHDYPAGGTVPYMSPEVLRGGPVDEAADVWSLGVVLYEMVTGRNPFAGGAIDDVIDRIRRQRLPAVDPVPDVSRAVLAFAGSMLSTDASARPRTARAFLDALRRL